MAPAPRPAFKPAGKALWKKAAAASWPGMVLAAALLLPFAGKAFTIDDTAFLLQAEHALTDPLHPSAVVAVWSESTRPVRLSQVMPGGSLMAWLLVPALLAGGSEIVAHLMQLALLLVAVFEVAALALRAGFDERTARLASLLLASTPTVLVMAGTAMPDVAAMTFGLVGIERLYAWRDHGRVSQAVIAAISLGLAPLARGHVLLLPGLALLIFGLPKHLSQWRVWLPVLAAPVITLAVLGLTQDPFGGTADVVHAAGKFSGIANVRSNLFAFGVHQVLLLPIGLGWMLSRGRSFWTSPIPWIVIAAAAAMMMIAGETRWLWLSPVAGLGVAVVIDVVRDAARGRDQDRRLLAVWLLVALPVVIYTHFPSKYLVPCAPAAAVLVASAVLALPARRAAVLAGGLIAAGALLGVLILRADSAFAGLGRRAVAELVQPNVAAGSNVWFNAHWGFQWYAQKAGARILTTTPPKPVRGDLVVSGTVTITGVQIRVFRERELLATVTENAPGGRIIAPELGVGFYSNGWGYLPWGWGRGEIDRFELWRIR